MGYCANLKELKVICNFELSSQDEIEFEYEWFLNNSEDLFRDISQIKLKKLIFKRIQDTSTFAFLSKIIELSKETLEELYIEASLDSEELNIDTLPVLPKLHTFTYLLNLGD